MDDWNDFGVAPASRPAAPPPSEPRSGSSTTTELSVSDSSIAILNSGSPSSSSYHTTSGTASLTSFLDNSSRDGDDQSSLLSSLPVLSGAKHQADRHAAIAAATALADGRMGFGFSDVIVPMTPSEHADRRAVEGDSVSMASEEDTVEPVSVRMPRSPGPVDDDDLRQDNGSYRETQAEKKEGDLEDTEGKYELNRSGMHFGFKTPKAADSTDNEEAVSTSKIVSALLSRAEKKYTKLEVISSRQVNHLVSFFAFFVALAVIVTITLIVFANGTWKYTSPAPLPEAFLTDAQIAESKAEFPKGEDKLQNPFPVLVSDTLSPGSRYSNGHEKSAPTGNSGRKGFVPFEVTEYSRKLFAAKGLYVTRDGVVRGPVVPLEQFPSFGQYEESDLPAKAQSFRNNSSMPSRVESIVSSGLDELKLVRQGTSSVEGDEPPSNPNESEGAPSDGAQDSEATHGEKIVYVLSYHMNFNYTLQGSTYNQIAHVIFGVLSVFFFVIGVLFSTRVARLGRRNISHEQIWVLVLIFLTAIYFNIFESALRLRDLIGPAKVSGGLSDSKVLVRFSEAFKSLRDMAFAGFCYFYIWASLHSYRILNPTERLGWTFYLPKLLVVLPYGVYRVVARHVMRIELSSLPLISAATFGYTLGHFRVWNYLKAELLYVLAGLVIELLMIGIICREGVRTARDLERAPYMKYRTKLVGFRFFTFVNLVFYPLLFTLTAMMLFSLPIGDFILRLDVATSFPQFDVLWPMTLGSATLIVGYVLTTAYVHLPANSVGVFKGWFLSSKLAASGSRWSFSSDEVPMSSSKAPSTTNSLDAKRAADAIWMQDDETPRSLVDNDDELEKQIVEPITYKHRESKDALELRANCFTMQTHVIMFNFAWYVYYYGTPKLDNFRPKENPLPFKYEIAGHVISEITDTQALVVDCSDRIIVAFKGTTSLKNLKTSLQISHEKLQSVVRTNVYDEDETTRLKRLFGRHYLNGKIHKGFAIAYQSVADEVMGLVRVLRDRKQRPVFLTGHSLGGALATICSLDLWVKLDVSRREIFVSTFGSPRVGNRDFAQMYRIVVPLHWRIVVDPDMVAKLPRVGYTHVGKKVVLTPYGEMLIDRSALETRVWSGERAGLAYHRKASYMLAMRAWCVRHHKMTYTPAFWPFPVRHEDNRRFAGAFEEYEERRPNNKVASKIIRMDAMIDFLGDGDVGLDNMEVVEKWARLARRLLLNDKLATSPIDRGSARL